jgi:very-short-patch-repair endonuclease
MAAVLACGDGSVVSHRSAADIWGLVTGGSRAPVEVTVVRSRAPSRPGICVHRARSLDARDVRRVTWIPVTSPARTILDLAVRVEAMELERMIADGIRRGLVRETQLRELLGRSRGKRGAVALRHAISGERGPAFTRSAAERKFLNLVRAARLPEPRVNVMVEGHEVDFLWPRHRLIVEIDGAAYHSDRAAFERDRLRDADLQAAGFRVIRVTWRQLTDDPRGTIVRLGKALERGGSPRSPAPC